MNRLLIVALALLIIGACHSGSQEESGRGQVTDDDQDGPDDDDGSVLDDDVVISRCPEHEDMILIPAGLFAFRYQGQRFKAENLTDWLVELPAYCIDEFEYPNQAGVMPTPVTWDEAESLCAAAGKRLCSGEEWQKACAGPYGWRFPWGEMWSDSVCNTHTDKPRARETAASGAWPDCVSYYGVYDMTGNMSEWTNEVWQDGWPDKTIRGGSSNINEINSQSLQPDGFWQFETYSQRCSSIHHHESDVLMTDDGTRCCADP